MTIRNRDYGQCTRCRTDLIVGDSATIDESKIVDGKVDGKLIYTGKKIFMIGYLQCPYCLKKYTVDDSFDRYI